MSFFTETTKKISVMMRVAVAFMLLISLAMAFNLEKWRIAFEDEPDEQTDLQEQDEFDLNEPGDYYEQKEREEQDENDEDNKVIERLKIGSGKKKHECLSNWLNLHNIL